MPQKCRTKYCRNDRAPGRTKCYKCRSRQYREEHPYAYHYNALRNNARRRGIKFTITIEDYISLWQDEEKWKTKLDQDSTSPWEVDRKDPRKGYEPGNLQILHKRKNILKYHNEDKFILEVNWVEKKEPKNNAPF